MSKPIRMTSYKKDFRGKLESLGFDWGKVKNKDTWYSKKDKCFKFYAEYYG